MSIPLVVNGVTFDYPEVDDTDWGPDATDWAAAVTSGMLQKAGGLFQLLADVDFGTSFGLKSVYLKSRTSNLADSGFIRMANTDIINWRNAANDDNLELSVDSNDVLNFNGAGISSGGVPVQPAITVTDTATIDLTLIADVLSADIKTDCITNAMINSAAAIAYSKLNLAASVANSDLVTMAQATIKGRASGAGTGAPVDLSATQATAILNDFVGDSGSGGTKGLVPAPASGDAAGGKFLKADGTWTAPAGAGDVVGPGSATDNGFVRFDGTTGKLIKNSPATITNADVIAAAAIALNKLAAVTASRALVSDGSGFISAATTTATEIGYVNGVTSAIQTQFSGKLPTTITTTGDMIYSSSGTTASRLPIGSAPQVIMPVAGVPAWAWPLSVQTSQTTTYSISANDQVVMLTSSGGAYTATLPTAASVAGKVFYIKKTDSSVNIITIATTSSQTIDGLLTYKMGSLNDYLTVVSDGSNWRVIEFGISVAALYTGAPPTGTLTNSFNTTTFGTKVNDSVGAYSAGTYTIFYPGRYDFSASTSQNGTYALGKLAITGIAIAGSTLYKGVQSASGTGANTLYPLVSVKSVSLSAGDLITVKCLNDSTSPTFASDATTNYFSITRTGN